MFLHMIGTPAFVACDVQDYLPHILVVTGFPFSLVLLYASLSPDEKVFDRALTLHLISLAFWSGGYFIVIIINIHADVRCHRQCKFLKIYFGFPLVATPFNMCLPVHSKQSCISDFHLSTL